MFYICFSFFFDRFSRIRRLCSFNKMSQLPRLSSTAGKTAAAAEAVGVNPSGGGEHGFKIGDEVSAHLC